MSLIYHSSSWSSSSLVVMTSENHHYFIWKINSHSIQMIVVLRQSEHKLNNWAFLLSLQAKKIVGGLIPLDVGTSLKSQFQPSKHLICSATFRKRLWCLYLNHLTELSCSYQNVYVRCSQHPQTTFEVQHTERCIKDISLLWSNEDNPQFTDLVRIIATINFQLIFL